MLPGLNEAPVLVLGLAQQNLGPVSPGQGSVAGVGATVSEGWPPKRPQMLPHLPLTSLLRHLTHATLWNGHEVLVVVAVVGRMVGRTSWTHISGTVLHGLTATPIRCTCYSCKSDKDGDQAPQYGAFLRSHS